MTAPRQLVFFMSSLANLFNHRLSCALNSIQRSKGGLLAPPQARCILARFMAMAFMVGIGAYGGVLVCLATDKRMK